MRSILFVTVASPSFVVVAIDRLVFDVPEKEFEEPYTYLKQRDRHG